VVNLLARRRYNLQHLHGKRTVPLLRLDNSLLHARRLLRVAVVLCVGACATPPPPRTAAERAADEVVATHVREALLRDPYLYAQHIDVDVDRGVVYLDGMIWRTDNFQDAKRIARTVPGVINVVTDLDLVRGGRR